ncbi:hypothetical protein EVJ58_g7095, partial [Rhodofomes roseus]
MVGHSVNAVATTVNIIRRLAMYTKVQRATSDANTLVRTWAAQYIAERGSSRITSDRAQFHAVFAAMLSGSGGAQWGAFEVRYEDPDAPAWQRDEHAIVYNRDTRNTAHSMTAHALFDVG